MNGKYRLLTRDDFDGFVCCLLLRKLDLIDEIKFVHPRDMQHHRVEIKDGDISANLPYVDGIYMAFDHHKSETLRIKDARKNFICKPECPSAARVIFEYFKMREKFPNVFDEVLTYLDKADTASFTKEDILDPKGWTLFNFILDPKTSFDRFHQFSMTNEELIRFLLDKFDGASVDDLLKLPQVQERILMYHTYQEHFIDQINRCALVHKNVVIVDLRDEEVIYPGNRFMVYALYPHCDLSLFIQKENDVDKVTFSMGKSILKKTCPINVGELMLKYNGGGHVGAGTCQSTLPDVEKVKVDLMGDIFMQYEGA